MVDSQVRPEKPNLQDAPFGFAWGGEHDMLPSELRQTARTTTAN